MPRKRVDPLPDVPWWASADPWAMSPDEAAALAARRAKREADMAALAETDPPVLKVTKP